MRVFAAIILAAGFTAHAQQRSVAITIDDGPAVNEGKDLGNFQRIARGLLSALEIEKVPATIFMNERQLNVQGQRDGRAAVFAQWLDAGFDLGNHTYSHPSANKVPVWQFEDDLIRGEVIMRSLVEARGGKMVWYRHPFLDSDSGGAPGDRGFSRAATLPRGSHHRRLQGLQLRGCVHTAAQSGGYRH